MVELPPSGGEKFNIDSGLRSQFRSSLGHRLLPELGSLGFWLLRNLELAVKLLTLAVLDFLLHMLLESLDAHIFILTKIGALLLNKPSKNFLISVSFALVVGDIVGRR